MRVGSLFSGIGGIDLGLERAGMQVAWQCEIDPWCRGILAKHWPGTPCYGDIRTIDEDAPRVDVLAGGFPCQPVSLAGKGLAQADERWLWPEFARLIRVLRPRYVIAENVPGLLARGLDIVLADLAALGFDAEWTVFGAWDVGAPHLRRRVWLVAADTQRVQLRNEPWRISRPGRANPSIPRNDGAQVPLAAAMGDPDSAPANTHAADRRSRSAASESGWWAAEPDVGRVAHGVPQRVDRLRALGNAVVPACSEHIGRLVMEMNA